METGDVVGYLLLKERKTVNGRIFWNCECKLCGSEKLIRQDALKYGTTISCGCYKSTKEYAEKIKSQHPVEDLTGNTYGELTVLHLADHRQGKHILWTCRCSCGNVVDVWSANLKNGNSRTCGGTVHKVERLKDVWDQNLDDLTGQTFGNWLVLERDGSKQPTRWTCKCQKCGEVKSVLANALKKGQSTSCGCIKHNESLVGQKIGHWDILHRSKRKRPSGRFCTTYLCRCDCGVERYVDESRLLNGTSLSCGCANSKANEYIADILKETGYRFVSEYSFDDLLGPNGGLLRFDFAVFDQNNALLCLIEYQGVQHFLTTDFGKVQREVTDPLKREYCRKNNIALYEINYNDNIDKELDKVLSHIACQSRAKTE